jgi:hypothetical protein
MQELDRSNTDALGILGCPCFLGGKQRKENQVYQSTITKNAK